MRCVTLMVNRSDRRFHTLSPSRAREAARLIENEARGNPSRPGPHLMPDKQAGYMTATEFHIASAIQPLTRAGSIYAWRSEVDSNRWSLIRWIENFTSTRRRHGPGLNPICGFTLSWKTLWCSGGAGFSSLADSILSESFHVSNASFGSL